ncbi:MAG: glucose-1-phosphate thymidylyltransferase RfbA [Acidimicrobiia bacterium]
MKGIILAGGVGSRLDPATRVVSKQLLPVYDKPMIYYPLSLLMLAGLTDVLVISAPEQLPQYRALLGDGSQWGISIQHDVQSSPDGLAQAFTIAEEFLDGSAAALVLGDNILYGQGLSRQLRSAVARQGATIFGYHVPDPERFGVVTLTPEGEPIGIEEKPERPTSDLAVVGLYFFDRNVVDVARSVKPSPRGELEIVDVIEHYLGEASLTVETLGRGVAWLDAGTPESLHEAAAFVHTVEKRQGFKIACLEEVAFRMHLISENDLERLSAEAPNPDYGRYLANLLSASPRRLS